MKLKSIIFSLIAIFSALFVDVVKAEVTAPSSFNVNGNDLYKINVSKILPNGGISGYNFHYKQNVDGKVIYCIQSHELAALYGTSVYTLGDEMDAKFAYVIANGYPNKSITGDKDTDYFITGFAVFYLVNPDDYLFKDFDFEKGTFKGTESNVVKEINKLLVGAKNYSYVEPTIGVNFSNNGFTLSNDKKYYVSSNIGVSTTGVVSDYKVSLTTAPSGTIVTDVNGNTKNTFSTNEKFIVKIPVSSIKGLSSEVKFDVSATGSIDKVYEYKNSDYQNSAVMFPEYKSLSSTATLKLNLTTKVKISKVDATNGKELPGATLVVKDSKGNVVDTWVSTNDVHVIENLNPGKYTLTETIAPEGYVLSKETINFEVKNDGSVASVVMKNEMITTEISKVDVTKGNELPGATLVVKDSDGNVVDTWVSGTEIHVIKGLRVGKYTLTETIAPEGYVLSEEVITFEVKNDGSVTKVVMKNKPKDKTPIYISKQDFTTKEELPGAHLELKNEKGEIVEAWVSGDIPHMIEELEAGKYYLTETIAPEGYELSSETIEFIVKEDGTVDGTIIMYNKAETVEVPSTSSFKTITSSLIGIVVIGLGSMIIYKNYKKNEEY